MGAEAEFMGASQEGRGQGLGPRPSQGSLLILPIAGSSAAQVSLAQCQGPKGCRAGQEEALAFPGSSLQGPRDHRGNSGLARQRQPQEECELSRHLSPFYPTPPYSSQVTCCSSRLPPPPSSFPQDHASADPGPTHPSPQDQGCSC